MSDSGDFLNEPFKYTISDEIRRDERERLANMFELSSQMMSQQPMSPESLNRASIYRDVATILRELK